MAYEFESELELEQELAGELEGEMEEEMEEEMEDEAGLEGEGWLGAIGNVVGSLLGEEEMEEELEGETEEELSPIRKIYPDAMMEHLGELAAEAETEDEAAEHFLPLVGMAASKLLPVVAKAAAPLAKKLLPKVARAVTKAAPRLTKGIGHVARTLHRNPQTRHLLKVVPTIARRAVGSVAHQAARGRVVTPHTAVRTLAQHAKRVLTHPAHRRRALRHHHRLERKFHRMYGPGMARPHWRWGRGGRRYGRYPYWHGRYGRIPRGAAPGAVVPARGVAGVRPGRIVGGRCMCPACPTCGAPAAAQPVAAAAPQYCRCCGQVLR